VQLSVEIQGDTGFICVQGDVDRLHGPRLLAVANELLSEGANNLVIDCREITFMDSNGLAALAAAHNRAEVQFGTVTLRNPSAFLLRLLELAGMDGLLLIDGAPSQPNSE
jgi:anti-anti-sigma factor